MATHALITEQCPPATGVWNRVLETTRRRELVCHRLALVLSHKQEALELSLPQMETWFGDHLRLPRMFWPKRSRWTRSQAAVLLKLAWTLLPRRD